MTIWDDMPDYRVLIDASELRRRLDAARADGRRQMKKLAIRVGLVLAAVEGGLIVTAILIAGVRAI